MIYEKLFGGERFPCRLTDQETYKLFKQGNIEAKKELVEHNIRLVIYLVNERFWSVDEEMEDLVEIGILGLIDAVENYNIKLKKPFPSFARKCICNRILMYINKVKPQKTNCSLDEPLLDCSNNESNINKYDTVKDNFDFIENILDKETCERVKSYLNLLTDTERTVIKVRYGFDCRPMTQVKAAEKLGISQSYLSRIEIRALKKLKMYFELDFNHKDIVKKIR